MEVIDKIYIIHAICEWGQLDTEIQYGLIKAIINVEDSD